VRGILNATVIAPCLRDGLPLCFSIVKRISIRSRATGILTNIEKMHEEQEAFQEAA